MFEASLMDMVLTMIGVFVGMTIISCICCLCMKYSDRRMKKQIIESAKKKGVPVDLDLLDPKNCQSPHANENCTIIIPDVGIILLNGSVGPIASVTVL